MVALANVLYASEQTTAQEVLHSLSPPRETRPTISPPNGGGVSISHQSVFFLQQIKQQTPVTPAEESDMSYGISMDTHPPLTAHALSCCALRHRLLASRPLVRRRGAPPLAGFTGFSSSPQVASCVEKIFLFLIIKQWKCAN